MSSTSTTLATSVASLDCAHTFSDYESCQRCGMPHCTECIPRGIIFHALHVELPFSVCGDCRSALEAADSLAAWQGDEVTVSPARLGAAAAALIALERAPWHGRGERVTLRGRAVAAAVVTAPALVLGGIYGALKGCAVGALGGLVSGGMMGGVAGFDAGARVGSSKESSKESGGIQSSKTSTSSSSPSSAAGISSGTAATAAAVTGDVNTTTGTTPPVPSSVDDVMARARAILRKSPEEQIADATSELIRVTAKGVTAYDVLRINKDATPEAIAKAHKAAAMAYHPDRNAAPDATAISQAVNAAYAIINDPIRRAAYDAGGAGDVAGVDDGLAAAAAGPVIKIKSSRVAAVAAAAGGFFGGVMGFGVGAAGGALVGTIGEAASTVRKVWSAAGRDVSPIEVAAGRSHVARVALALRTSAFAWDLKGLDVGLDTKTGELRIRCIGLRSALLGVRKAFSAPTPVRMVDLPHLDDMTFAPSVLYIERLAKCAGTAPSARIFTAKLARALAASAKAARKELSIPDPQLDDGDGSVSNNTGDATGLVGEDTYDAVLERRAAEHAAKGPITSGRGLVGHAMTEVLEMGRSAATKEDAKIGLVLTAAWEAASRGRDPSADILWISRRVAALAGAPPADGLTSLDDPDSDWNDITAPPRSFDSTRAAAFLEISALGEEGGVIPKSTMGRGGSSGGALKPSTMSSPQWIRIGELTFGVDGDGDSATSILPNDFISNVRGNLTTTKLGIRIVIDSSSSSSSTVTPTSSNCGVQIASTILSSVDWEALGVKC